ncbi:Reverse transcriptase (RNA-dependent DNA polymerase) [Nesidiocoris tenuis]|uniref:Reverse transcriptase (RNA-dependent DNA polymerase) n=2 Tax=Nesidiocoris tenuis TaxID=355587 RepID=A0ABN7B2H5_9HEMI|nr:Reverse transcriptase (RNA-dependent DNA polymerase) [Nesidiocoris tenuis]
MNRDIVKWAKACIPCQKSKITRHVKSPLGKYPEVDQRFDVVHIDIVGPLPISDGYLYCLTCIDRFSSWVEVIPLKNIDAETVAKNFFKEWIARFGTPLRIHCDQGRQFMSELFSSLAKLCGSQIQRTTPYHPQAQGKIERFHRTLKAAIRAHGQKKWTEVLPTILLGIRASIKLDANASIAEMLYGMPLRLPGDFFNETSALEEDPQEFVRELKKRMEELKPTPETQKSRFSPFVHKELMKSKHVFVRIDRLKPSLTHPYEGPFEVVERTPKFFTLRMKGADVNISVDRLKPAFIAVPDDFKEEDVQDERKSKVEEKKMILRSGKRVSFCSSLEGE